jgi:hypothetical protein
MAGVVPKEVIRPTAWLTQGIEVAAAEKVSLNDQMLNVQFACGDPMMHPLMTWIKAASVASHGNSASLALNLYDTLGIHQFLSHWNFNQDMLSRLQALYCLGSM